MFLTDKPWLTTGVIDTQAKRTDKEMSQDQAWSGFKLLLCVLSMLFIMMVTAYIARMDIADWQRLSEPWMLWFNSVLLFLSSVAMSRAQQAIKHDDFRLLKINFISAGFLTLAFLAGQLVVWQQYHSMGYLLASNPANTLFYLVTGIHGLHLLVGLLVWANASRSLLLGVNSQQLSLKIDLCAAYWHYLLLIWFVLFGLLVLT